MVPVVVAFSGGGFRASLAGLGVLRFLADAKLLPQVREVSSVSGGSWAAALLALNWKELEERDFGVDAVDDLIVRPFVTKVTTTSLQRQWLLSLWRAIGPAVNRTDLFADVFDDWFGHGRCLGDLPDDCRFMFNSTNLRSGKRFVFEKERVGDYEVGYIDAPSMRVADALAASAAIPGAMAAQRLAKPHNREYKLRRRPQLVDGAVYDNLGTEPFLHLGNAHPLIVSIDAGGVVRYGIRFETDLIGVLRRSSAVMRGQTTSLRQRWMVERFRRWQEWRRESPEEYAAYAADPEGVCEAYEMWDRSSERPPFPPRYADRGVACSLDSSTDRGLAVSVSHERYDPSVGPPIVPPWHRGEDAAFIDGVADMPMSVKKLDPILCRDVIYRSWWLSRAFLSTYHDDIVPDVAGWTEWYRGA